MLETGGSKGRAVLLGKLPRAACWGWIQALVAGRGSGKRNKPASPYPELTPGVAGWIGRWAALPCTPHLMTENSHPRIRPLLQELWTGSSVVWWRRLRMDVQTPRLGRSYLWDLSEVSSSQSPGKSSGLQPPMPEGFALSSRALQSGALYPGTDPLSPPVN